MRIGEKKLLINERKLISYLEQRGHAMWPDDVVNDFEQATPTVCHGWQGGRKADG
jgi:hypothetical protein